VDSKEKGSCRTPEKQIYKEGESLLGLRMQNESFWIALGGETQLPRMVIALKIKMGRDTEPWGNFLGNNIKNDFVTV
jgi:hypothetical protein